IARVVKIAVRNDAAKDIVLEIVILNDNVRQAIRADPARNVLRTHDQAKAPIIYGVVADDGVVKPRLLRWIGNSVARLKIHGRGIAVRIAGKNIIRDDNAAANL